jgi:hypothetical protein
LIGLSTWTYFYELKGKHLDILNTFFVIRPHFNNYYEYVYFFTENFLYNNCNIIHNRNIDYKVQVGTSLAILTTSSVGLSSMLQAMIKIGYDVIEPSKFQELSVLNDAFINSQLNLQWCLEKHLQTANQLYHLRSSIDIETNSCINLPKAYTMLNNSALWEIDSFYVQSTFNEVHRYQANVANLKALMVRWQYDSSVLI